MLYAIFLLALLLWTLLYFGQDTMIFQRGAAPSPLRTIPYDNALFFHLRQNGQAEAGLFRHREPVPTPQPPP